MDIFGDGVSICGSEVGRSSSVVLSFMAVVCSVLCFVCGTAAELMNWLITCQ